MTNERLKHLLCLGGGSIIVAVLCYFMGGAIAEAASATPIMGMTFKAGGSLAGFLIAFVTLFVAYQKMRAASLMLKVTVTLQTGRFTRAGVAYSAKATVLKRAAGSRVTHDASAIWEAGGLTIHLRDIEEDDLVMIALTDGNGGNWESDYFSPLCPSITLA